MGTLQIAYGSYTHAVGEVELSFRRSAVSGASETPYAERIEIDLSGTLIGNGIADMNAKVNALIAGYAFDGNDFKVLDQDGLLQRLSVASSGTLGGIRITRPPTFPTNRDAAYVTFLPYQIGLACEVPIASPETVLVSFEETLSFTGGGPVYDYLETRVGVPQKQLLTRRSVYQATQTGSAVGLYNIPLVPNAIWPTLQNRAPSISKKGGRLVGSGNNRRYMFKGVRWNYTFKSAVPLFGTPNNWGAE